MVDKDMVGRIILKFGFVYGQRNLREIQVAQNGSNGIFAKSVMTLLVSKRNRTHGLT